MSAPDTADDRSLPSGPLPRTVVLVGLMGAGKSSIGRLIAQRLDLEFVDADSEIEAAAGCTVEEIFARHGENEFRAGERRVIARLLRGPVRIIATGGGAFMEPETRRRIREKAVSVWLKADLATLLKRVARRNDRPLLKGRDPRAVLERLMAERAPVYAEADIAIETADEPPERVAERTLRALERHFGVRLPAARRVPGRRGRPAPGRARPPRTNSMRPDG